MEALKLLTVWNVYTICIKYVECRLYISKYEIWRKSSSYSLGVIVFFSSLSFYHGLDMFLATRDALVINGSYPGFFTSSARSCRFLPGMPWKFVQHTTVKLRVCSVRVHQSGAKFIPSGRLISTLSVQHLNTTHSYVWYMNHNHDDHWQSSAVQFLLLFPQYLKRCPTNYIAHKPAPSKGYWLNKPYIKEVE